MKEKKPPTPEVSEEEAPAHGSSYGEESDLDPKDILEKKMKDNFTYQAKNKKTESKQLIKQQNAQVVQSKKEEQPVVKDNAQPVPDKGKKFQKVLGKKKTVRDNKGDEWEVVDKRETMVI